MKISKNLFLLLGISLFTQAATSLIGGVVGIGPFSNTYNYTAGALSNVANNIHSIYTGVLLQIVTAAVIIVLGAALYQAGKYIDKTMAIVALCFYVAEAILIIVDQLFIFALIEVSHQYLNTNDTVFFLRMGNLLVTCYHITYDIVIIPFGLGAMLFYYLIMKAKIIPKWLGLWGLITVPPVLVLCTLGAFGVSVPFILAMVLMLPYLPWEFFTGLFILIKGLSGKSMNAALNEVQ